MKILALDPSGNFYEGQGTTGWALLDEQYNIIDCGQVRAKDFTTRENYWKGITSIIEEVNPNYLVIEDYLLYANKAQSQINSRFETPKLIGLIEYQYGEKTSITLQRAVDVKKRWKDDILVYKGYVTRKGNHYYINDKLVSGHTRDALRHGIHFITFKLKKGKIK